MLKITQLSSGSTERSGNLLRSQSSEVEAHRVKLLPKHSQLTSGRMDWLGNLPDVTQLRYGRTQTGYATSLRSHSS